MFDWGLPEEGTIDCKAYTEENQPDKLMARMIPVTNLIDDFMSKNQVGWKGDAQKTGCDVRKALRINKEPSRTTL